MDRLIEDYEKALTAEFELREPVHQCRWQLRGWETKEMVRVITDDLELPQWKAKRFLDFELYRSANYRSFEDQLREAEYEHGKANIRLLVATERLKLTRARLYGGRNEVLDMQEVASVDNRHLD